MSTDLLTLLLILVNLVWLSVIQRRLSRYLQLLRRRAGQEPAGFRSSAGEEWTLASTLDDGKLCIYTAQEPGRFSLRIVLASLPTGAAELMCLPREVDLISTWNKFCGWGEVLRLTTPTELWAGAVLALPWPVPKHSILVHAQMHDRMQEDGCVFVEARTPETFEGTLPAQMRACPQTLPIAASSGRLTPLPPDAATGAPRTAADVSMTVSLTGLGWMGGVASGVPQWLINLILVVVTPLVYRRALQVLADLSPETALGKRLRVDETGVYEIIRTCAGQRAAHPTPQRLQST